MRKFSDNNMPLIPWETFTKQPANRKVNVTYCCDEPTLCSWSVGNAIQHKPHCFVMEIASYKYRALTLTQSQNSHCSLETATSMAPHSVIHSTFDHQRFTDKDKFKVCSFILLVITFLSKNRFFALFMFWHNFCSNQNLSSLLTAEKANGWKDAQRSHKQLHRSAEEAVGEGAPQPRSKCQAGKSWHPGDDRQLPEAAAENSRSSGSERL